MSRNELQEGVHKSTVCFSSRPRKKCYDPKWPFLADFGYFWPFFWQFFNAKIARSQNKGNSYYKNLENNIPLDFVIGIFPILTSWNAISKKLPKKSAENGQNQPKMHILGQKNIFSAKK